MDEAPPTPGQRRRWNRHGLHTRIVLVVAVAMVGPTVLVAWTAWTGIARARQELVAERTILIRSVGEHLEYVLRADLEALQTVGAARRGAEGTAEEPAAERGAVREAWLRSHVLDGVLLLSDPETVVWEEPARLRREPPAVLGLSVAREAFTSGRPAVSDLVGEPDGGKRIYVLVPLRGWDGRVVRVAVGLVNPESERLLALIRPFRVGERGSAELVDRAGTVIATTDPARRYTASHAPGDDFPALVPLALVPWSLAMRGPEIAEAGSLGALWGRLTLISAAVLAVGLLFAWGAAWSIRRPLRILTGAAERIAGGGLGEPIPPLGDDEVGRLGRALDHMRATLRESHQTLEARVEERTRELERLYRELSARDQSRAELLRKVISAQEEERRRVARELHDETSQSLAALAMSLDTALSTLPAGPARARLEEARTIAGRAIDELHRLLFDLRPSVLDDLGLQSAIRWCAERHLERLGVVVRCEFSGFDQRLPAEMETALFRVVQEAVTNIAKHAHADTVLIQCAVRDDVATIEIEDDGSGFDPAAAPAGVGTGLGLAGMRERVTLLGGTVQVDSSPGEGARVVVEVPIPAEAAHA